MIAWVLAGLMATGPLLDAVRERDAEAVRALLGAGVDVNAPAADGATALHWAAYLDDADLVELLLASGARADAANDLGVTPLHLAAANGNAAIVAALLAHGADPGAASEAGITPLMEAARAGSAAAVRALVARGADVDTREAARGQTALMWAAARRHPDVVRVLLDAGADVDARSRVRPVVVMLDRGPRRTVKTSRQDAVWMEAGGYTALLFAAQAGDVESIRLLLGAGAGVDDPAPDGRSPLVLAAFAGHGAAARALIEAGADVDAAGAGYTALHAAVLRGDLGTVRALLARGADPDTRLARGSPVRRFGSQWALPNTLRGATPLFLAAAYLEIPILRALLEAGADHTIGLLDGTTPLHAAAGLPVEKEARPSDVERWNLVDSDSPLIPRDEGDAHEAARLLLDAGAAANRRTQAGDTPLHGAAAAGMTRLIQLLASRGADLDAVNGSGETPLSLTLPRPPQPGRAGTAGRPEVADLLRRLGATR